MNWPEQWLLAGAALAAPATAAGSETITYSYDALGRLIAVSTAGGPNDGTAVSTAYDPAGNRTSYGVAGAGAAAAAAPASVSAPETPAIEDAAAGQPAQEPPAVDAVAPEEEPGAAGEPDGDEEGGTPGSER